jgi:cellulose synthase/poly-beta-1,6-N-acetylglucosamine synthase-like glycosyltransferase
MREQVEHKQEPMQRTIGIPEDYRSIEIQMKRYFIWLFDQAQRDQQENQAEIQAYANQARRIIEAGNRRIQIFAPFRYRYSALYTITQPQAVTLILVGLLVFLCLLWSWENTLVAMIALVTLGYLVHLALDGLLVSRALNGQGAEDIRDEVVHLLVDAPWPPYTILCPLYREAPVVAQFVKAMKALDYPADKLQILFLTEEDDLETRAAIRAMKLPAHFEIVTVPAGYPRTKPRACNYGLTEATGYYTVIYDAEDKPEPLQLKKAVLTFARYDESLACVQARLNFYNPRQNLLTRWFTAEYSQWFDIMLPGLQKTRLVIPLGGTSNHFVTQTLRALGGWDAFNVTEDCDLGLHMAHFGLKTVILRSTTYEEANSQVKNWIRQRSRWIKGYMQTYLVHIRNPLPDIRKGRWRELFSLQVVIGGKTAVLLINPLVWIMTLLYLLFRPPIYNQFFPIIVLYMSIFCFIAGNFFYCYTYMMSCARREQYDLVPWMLLLPVYWLLNSIAAYMALYELIVRPHYWQKTQHGFHLQHSKTFAISTQQLEEEKEAAARTGRQQPGSLTLLVDKYTHLKDVPSILVEDAIHAMVARHKSALLPSELVELERSAAATDSWLTRICWLAFFISLLARWFFFYLHKSFDYPDSIAHLQLARQILRGSTPAVITNMGGNWLPLSYYSMALLSWQDYLWRTETAGAILAMASFVACAICIFLIGRRLTHNSLASFLGTLVFILNPAILYLQSMSLPVMIGLFTLVLSCYYLLAWVQTDELSLLIKAGIGTFLATLITYEGWALTVILFIMVLCINLYKRHTRQRIISDLMIYGMLGFIGVITWILWEWTAAGDTLYFLHALGPYPGLSLEGVVAAFPSYGLLLVDHAGLLLCMLAVPGIVLLVIHHRAWPALLTTVLLLIVPWLCYLVAIYLGLLDPFNGLTSDLALQRQIIRADLGALITVEVAIFMTVLAAYLLQMMKAETWKELVCVALILIILGQALWGGTQVLTLLQPGPQQLPLSYLVSPL